MNIKKWYIMIFSIIFVFILSKNIYAKYKYIFKLDCYELTRDSSEIEYQLEISDSNKEYTNNDVLIKIIANKEIEPVENFEISEDRRILTRLITENESKKIILNDLSGNSILVEYNVLNIDKIPPEIIGIQDGGIYSEVKNITYKDNIGIRSIVLNKYDDLKRIHKITTYDTEVVNENNMKNIIDEGCYNFIVTDFAGNKTECKIIIKK